MVDQMDSEQTLDYYKKNMGEEFGTVFYKLDNVWTYALIKSQEYRVLFSNWDNLELINAIGGRFFASIQDVLYDDILLQLTRITDKTQIAGRKNLTIQMLPDYCDDEELSRKVTKLVKQAVNVTDFARDWRNRRIAHMDYVHHMDSESYPLKPASLEKVQKALDAIHTVLNEVQIGMTGRQSSNGVISDPIAQQLITNLERMSDHMLYVDSLESVEPGIHIRNLIDKVRSVRDGQL